MKRRILAALVPALLLAGAGRALAASSAAVHIDVAIIAALSVEIDGGASSTQAVSWNAATPNAALVSPATATVRNDTGGLTTKWALSAAPVSINLGGGPDNWTLAASTSAVGADAFALQAVLGSSGTAVSGCPAAAAADWNESYAPPLTASPVNYTSTTFADPNLNSGGTPNPDITAGAADGRMFAGSRRALCWRLITPASTSATQTQSVQIVVTAVAP